MESHRSEGDFSGVHWGGGSPPIPDSSSISLARYFKEFEIYQNVLESASFSPKLLKASKLLAPLIKPHIPMLDESNVVFAAYLAAKYLLLNERELEFFIAAVEDYFRVKFAFILAFPPGVMFAFMRGYIFGQENLGKVPEMMVRLILAFFIVGFEVKQACSSDHDDRLMFLQVFPHLLSREVLRHAEQLYAVPIPSERYSLIKLNDIHKSLEERDSSYSGKCDSSQKADGAMMMKEEVKKSVVNDPDSFFNDDEVLEEYYEG